MGSTVLILGGGIGGITAARRLRKRLDREHRVVLVEREAQHVFTPSLLWLNIGLRTPEEITRPLAALQAEGIELVQGTIESIDPVAKSARVAGRELRADHLVIALGADLAPQAVPGLAAAGHNLYDLAGAQALRDARGSLRAGRFVILVCALPFKCPAAPYEAAMLLEYDLRKRGLRDRVEIAIFTPEPGPMPVAGAAVSAQIRQMIEAKGIAYHPEHVVERVDAATRRIVFKGGATTAFDLLAYVPPHRAPQVVRDAGLVAESGWIPVDRGTLQTRFPGVYAIGDVAGIMLTAIGRPLPKAGVLARGEAEVVADNLVHAVTGRGEPRRFEGDGACFLETGDGKAGFGSGNFYAEPAPRIALRPPARLLHWGKIATEKYWLFAQF
jgi:sulfide:quinone oxidoreductase